MPTSHAVGLLPQASGGNARNYNKGELKRYWKLFGHTTILSSYKFIKRVNQI